MDTSRSGLLLRQAARAVEDGQRSRPLDGPVRVGVDLGTAFTVVMATDSNGVPLAGALEFADVVRDGVVYDFSGAVSVVRGLKASVEARLGVTLTRAASTYPPGVPVSEVRATRYVLEAAGFECSVLVDEPTAANAVLRLSDGVVVDVGGGTTGLAVVEDGDVVYTADEPTGGKHLTLVLAGHFHITLTEAERRKRDPSLQEELFPLVRPVMEKIGTIVERHLEGRSVPEIHLVGGTSAYPGIAGVIADITGVPTSVAPEPMLVTPLGVALHDGDFPPAPWAPSASEAEAQLEDQHG